MPGTDDLAILIGFLGTDLEKRAAEELLQQRYLRKVCAFVAHLAPYATVAEVCKLAKLVLTEFRKVAECGELQDEAEVCSALIKQSRRIVAGFLDVKGHFQVMQSKRQSNDGVGTDMTQYENWGAKKPVREVLQNLPDDERLVLKVLVQNPDLTLSDLQVAEAIATDDRRLTVVEIRQARQRLINKTEEVIDSNEQAR